MKNSYICPHCRALLNPHDHVILIAAQGTRKHLVLFSPEIGDYTIHKSNDISFETGELVDFVCPLCHWNLSSLVAEDLAEIMLQKEDGSYARISFSRTYGKKATFLIDQQAVHSFGTDAECYQGVNWFGAGRFWESNQVTG